MLKATLYNWDTSQFDLIPEVEIDQNQQSAQTTISSDNKELEDLSADGKLFPDNEWIAKYEERKEKRLTVS